MAYAIEFKTHPEANYNPYAVNYYCYEGNCPGRKNNYGAPCQKGTYKYATVISRKGTTYRRKRWVCDYCGNVMTGTVSMYVFG